MNPLIVTIIIALATFIISIFGASWLNQQAMNKRIDDLRGYLDARFAAQDTRFAAIEQRLDRIERHSKLSSSPPYPRVNGTCCAVLIDSAIDQEIKRTVLSTAEPRRNLG